MTTINAGRARRHAPLSIAIALLLIGGLFGFAAPVHAKTIPAPSGLRASYVASQGIGLTWKVTGQDAYRVRFSENKNMSKATTWDVVGNYFEWTRTNVNPNKDDSPRLKPGTTYYFQVRAVTRNPAVKNRVNLSGYSKAIAVKTKSDKYLELEPTQIKATPAGSDSMYISWKSRGPGQKYLVRYTTDPSKPVLKWDSAKFDVAGGTITGLKPDTRYYFRPRVLTDDGGPLSLYSAPVSRSTLPKTTSPGITVISYNVLKSSAKPAWDTRRDAVAANIVAQDPDVLGLQEASPLKVTGSNGAQVTQYDDLVERLGSKYSLATRRGSSGTKLAYNTQTLNVVRADAKALTTLGSAQRYAAWGVFEEKKSKKQFFVINTHLEPGNENAANNDARIRQAKEILDIVEAQGKGLPVMIIGDMNSNRNTEPNNGQYTEFSKAGYIDVLDNETASWESSTRSRAEHLIDIDYNSFNGLERKARRTSFPVGTYISYMYVSPSIRVAMYRNVVNLDRNRRFVGTIPSDHNMLMMKVHLE